MPSLSNTLSFLSGPIPLVPLIIKELSGKFRPIVFFGSALPREGRETTIGGSLRGKTTYYAGNPEPTSQSLGPEEEPIRFGGMLEDRRLGAPGSAQALMFLIDSVRKSGRTCLFSWGPILRTVRWKSASFRPTELTRITYDIELEVLSDGVGTLRRLVRSLKSTPSLDGAMAALDGAEALFTSLPVAVGVSALATTGQAIGAAQQLVESSKAELETPGASPARKVGALTKLRAADTLVATAEASSRTVDWLQAGAPSLANLATVGLPVLRARSRLQDVAVELRAKTPRVESLAERDETGSVLYVVAHGDSLRRIAQRYYGTASRWTDILTDNGLDSPELTAGQTLRLRRVPDPDKTVFQGSRRAW